MTWILLTIFYWRLFYSDQTKTISYRHGEYILKINAKNKTSKAALTIAYLLLKVVLVFHFRVRETLNNQVFKLLYFKVQTKNFLVPVSISFYFFLAFFLLLTFALCIFFVISFSCFNFSVCGFQTLQKI